jgi:hypothetical protein
MFNYNPSRPSKRIVGIRCIILLVFSWRSIKVSEGWRWFRSRVRGPGKAGEKLIVSKRLGANEGSILKDFNENKGVSVELE